MHVLAHLLTEAGGHCLQLDAAAGAILAHRSQRPGGLVGLDLVAEEGAENEGFAMTRPGGSYFVIGYGGTLVVPTLDVISTERNIIGNIVGTYNELAELMVLAQAGKVTLHTKAYPLDAAQEALHDLDAGKVRGRAILVP